MCVFVARGVHDCRLSKNDYTGDFEFTKFPGCCIICKTNDFEKFALELRFRISDKKILLSSARNI